MTKHLKITARLPTPHIDWLRAEAQRNDVSVNAEIVRSIRERIDLRGVGRGSGSGQGSMPSEMRGSQHLACMPE